MITNAGRATWPGDVPIEDASARGFLIPSKVRTAKIASIAAATATKLGTIDAVGGAAVRRVILDLFDVY